MAQITVELSDDVIRRFAEEIAHARAERVLADAGMTGGKSASVSTSATPPPPDPWGEPADGDWLAESPETRSAPSRRQSAPAARTVTVSTPKGQQRWTMNAGNAPLCQHDEPAAYIEGKTNGKTWKRWGCALGVDRDTWQNKCDFSQWA